MKYTLISLLLFCALLSAENLDFLKNNYLSEYFHHSRERGRLVFEEGTLKGSYQHITSKGNLLYDGTFSKDDEFTKRDMTHTLSYATKKGDNSYTISLGYGLDKDNRDEYQYGDHTIISLMRNTLQTDFSFRRALSSQRSLLFSLQTESAFSLGERILFSSKGDDATTWDIYYHNYNTPNITQSVAVKIGHVLYLQTKYRTPFIWLTDLTWDFETFWEDDPVNLKLVEAYTNNEAVDNIYFSKNNRTSQTWRLRSSLLGVKEDAKYIYPIHIGLKEKYPIINLHELTLELSQDRTEKDYERIEYSQNSQHLKSSNTWYLTNLNLITDFDFTLFTYFFIGARSYAGINWGHDSSSNTSFYLGAHPEIGFRTRLFEKLFLTVRKELLSVYITDFYTELNLFGDNLNRTQFPLNISLSYKF